MSGANRSPAKDGSRGFVLTRDRAEQWFSNSMPLAMWFLGRFGLQPDDRLDIFQHAALQILRKYQGLMIEHPNALLTAVLHNIAMRFLRLKGRYVSLDDEMIEDPSGMFSDNTQEARQIIDRVLQNSCPEVVRIMSALIASDLDTEPVANQFLRARGIEPSPKTMKLERNRIRRHKVRFIETGRRLVSA